VWLCAYRLSACGFGENACMKPGLVCDYSSAGAAILLLEPPSFDWSAGLIAG
jgi:hypothetical protein